MNVVSVSNVINYNNRSVPNQFIITGEDYILFQSFNSPIAMKKGGKVYIFKDWDYSVTTGKYRNQFLGETKKETLKKIATGEYIKVD